MRRGGGPRSEIHRAWGMTQRILYQCILIFTHTPSVGGVGIAYTRVDDRRKPNIKCVSNMFFNHQHPASVLLVVNVFPKRFPIPQVTEGHSIWFTSFSYSSSSETCDLYGSICAHYVYTLVCVFPFTCHQSVYSKCIVVLRSTEHKVWTFVLRVVLEERPWMREFDGVTRYVQSLCRVCAEGGTVVKLSESPLITIRSHLLENVLEIRAGTIGRLVNWLKIVLIIK